MDGSHASEHLLSPRQLACLRLVAVGKTTLEIAAELGISNRTVRWAYRKLLWKAEAVPGKEKSRPEWKRLWRVV